MPLSDMAIRKAKTRDTAYKLYDELGLYLIVSPSGSRLWRMKFKHRGLEKKLSFGSYPEVSLRDARKLRDDARDVLAEGKDPVLEKQREKKFGPKPWRKTRLLESPTIDRIETREHPKVTLALHNVADVFGPRVANTISASGFFRANRPDI